MKNSDIFLISAQNIDCGYLLELPHRGSSNEYHNNIDCGYSLEPPRQAVRRSTQICFWAELWKISEFLSKNFQFLVVKASIYLNRLVFLM